MNPDNVVPAELIPDSLPEADAVLRGSPESEWRRLSFRASGLVIELQISTTGDSRRLVGNLIPRQSAIVEIRHESETTTVNADTLGRFTADSIPGGKVSIRCRLGPDMDYLSIVTGWIHI